jgi:hypothetical protein
MLAKDQIKLVAEELNRTADARMHDCEGELERQHLWEVVRRASHAIQAVADIEREELDNDGRRRRARYLVSELETALDAARRARTVLEWRRDDRTDARA